MQMLNINLRFINGLATPNAFTDFTLMHTLNYLPLLFIRIKLSNNGNLNLPEITTV